jgi:transketolase
VFDKEKVESIAAQIRADIIESIGEAGSGHPGGSLSAVDILATLYFGEVAQLGEQDHFILSKGHGAPALYATLAHAGYFDRTELKTLRKLGSRLQGHPESLLTPGVEVSTGSLGQGFSVAAGYALGLLHKKKLSLCEGGVAPEDAAKLARGEASTVFVLLGDGELQEGQVWETIQFASFYRTPNLVAIVDKNNLQIDGPCIEVVQRGNIADKFKAFDWKVIEADGHDVVALNEAIFEAKEYREGPVVIVAETIKGKGVSFMEGKVGWHGKAPSGDDLKAALEELGR